MAAPFFARASRPSLLLNDGSAFVCNTCRRHESSYRRTRKMLRVKQDPSFQPSKTETQDHIIFNPPSSAPSIYHTPQKFLPKSDPRRRLHTIAPNASATPPSTPASSTPDQQARSRLPAPVRPIHEKKYHLKPEQVEEIRRLRAEDPRRWTRVRLAEKFECSAFFVSLCCCAPEVKAAQDKQLADIKNRWGRQKTEAREERQARKALWGRDA